MATQGEYFKKEAQPVSLPLWREWLSGLDWLALRTAPVYYGRGVPKGDGAPVILVPGFLATDIYLREMQGWLRRLGYTAYLSGIGRNANCPNILLEKLHQTVEKAYRDTGNRKVHLIGHSLGGVLARALAVRYPHLVASVITLASPFRGVQVANPAVLAAGKVVRQVIQLTNKGQKRPQCFTGFCNCPAAQAMRRDLPQSIQQTAIYTKTDGVVDWHFCITEQPKANFEVTGTHLGLAFNPSVYQLVAHRLHRAAKKPN